jgi:hypothetical protein
MEKIALMGTARKHGRWMKKNEYERFYQLILSEVTSRQQVRLQELLDTAANTMAKDFPINFSWLLLQVKHDMEARGVIQSSLDIGRNQLISVSQNNKPFQSLAVKSTQMPQTVL